MSVVVYDTPLTIEAALSALEAHPPTIARLTEGLSASRLRRRASAGDWSINDVLAHLRSCDDMWGRYMRLIVDRDHPTFRAVNPRTWIKSTNYPELDFELSLGAYARQRADLVAFLRALPPAAWSRSATVTGAGKARERTVLDYAEWLANHERSHLRQIASLAARRQ